MNFFLEMLLTAVVALLFTFPVAKLVFLALAGNSGGRGNDPTSDQAEIGVGDDFVKEEPRFGMKIDARVLHSQRNFRVVDENVEHVDELQKAANGEELVLPTSVAESMAAVKPENVIAEEMVVRGQDERHDSAEEIGAERQELMVRTTEAESAASVSPENMVAEETMIREQEEQSESRQGTSACVENEESGDVVVAESEEVRVEESNTEEESENKMELMNTEEESELMEASKEKEELNIEEEEDDDWEGIETSELEKAFAAAAKLLEESGKAEEIGAESKMELYGLHKIATQGSCREAQPMAFMVSACAKWNAWQKLGNMNQEEAMEQYLALVSKEIPGLMNTAHAVGKMTKMDTSVVLPSNSGSLEDLDTLDKNVSGEK